LLLATNQNDILAHFFQTRVYRRGPVHHTLAPAMDIQVASNFERYLYYALNQDPHRLNEVLGEFQRQGSIEVPAWPAGPEIIAGAVDDAAIAASIARLHGECGKIVDPHTATALHLHRLHPSQDPTVIVSTAHPAKFPEAILDATGVRVTHPRLEPLRDQPARVARVDNSPEVIKGLIAGATL
jgi:threonine synthase